MTLRTLYLESHAGVAGDMFTAAFLDAGLVSSEAIQEVPRLLGVPEVSVEISDAQRAQARATRVRVVLPEGVEGPDHHHVGDKGHDHTQGHHHGTGHDHHHYPALVRQIESSDLNPTAIQFALQVFRLLAEAEADSHGVPVEKVVFHEVGALDSVVDVAMAGVCVATVSSDRVLASPVKLGRGTIRIQHGAYPVPPPASARLAVGMPIAPVPEAISRPNVELSTPTGLAILKALNPDFVEGWPEGTLQAQGSGAGSTDLGDYPNVFRVALLEQPTKAEPPPFDTDTVVELRCNVDDQTGERTAWIMEKALEHGALDGWVTQIVGKKGRPAVCMSFLVRPEDVPSACDFLLRHSSTFGVRYAPWGRVKLFREEEIRDTPEGPVSYKIGRTADGETVKEKPEYEDLKKIWDNDPDFIP